MNSSSHDGRSERSVLYVVLAVVVTGLSIWALAAFEPQQDTAEARSKAAELAVAFEQAGLRAPSEDLIVRTLGEDGGTVCTNADNALNRAGLDRQLSNGAALAGVRPVIADRRVVKGVELSIDVYCPDRLPRFRNYLQGLKSADSIQE